ncbi:hypothetical protein HAX54_001851 [Datura stramonium]|uniref:Uncharacterized protein n=1 Tax=Datura stramonium TaxID=4076 RepID=A0ABS8T475_DATST|nr:hypothetical protein [Datura stramonium]
MNVNNEKENSSEGLASGVSEDEVPDKVTMEEPSCMHPSLTPGDVLIVKGLAQVAQGSKRKQWEVIAEEEHHAPYKASRTKQAKEI